MPWKSAAPGRLRDGETMGDVLATSLRGDRNVAEQVQRRAMRHIVELQLAPRAGFNGRRLPPSTPLRALEQVAQEPTIRGNPCPPQSIRNQQAPQAG